jgi:hypothetical protein
VLVALAILGTAVVVSIQAVGQGLRLLKSAGDQQQAIIVADQKARELLVPTESSESGTAGRFSWERTSRVLVTPELTPPDQAPEWRVFEISVVVTWDEQRRLEISTLRTVPATSDATQTGEAFAGQTGSGGTSTTGGTSRSGATDTGASRSAGTSTTGGGTARSGSDTSRGGRTSDAPGTSRSSDLFRGGGASDAGASSRGAAGGGRSSPSSRSRSE